MTHCISQSEGESSLRGCLFSSSTRIPSVGPIGSHIPQSALSLYPWVQSSRQGTTQDVRPQTRPTGIEVNVLDDPSIKIESASSLGFDMSTDALEAARLPLRHDCRHRWRYVWSAILYSLFVWKVLPGKGGVMLTWGRKDGATVSGGSGSWGEGGSFPAERTQTMKEQLDGDEKCLLLMLVTRLAGSLEENLLERAHLSESASVGPQLSVADITTTRKSWYVFTTLLITQDRILLVNTVRARGRVSKCI
jgi:hypothetical protein